MFTLDRRVDKLVGRVSAIEGDFLTLDEHVMGKSSYWSVFGRGPHEARIGELERKLQLVMEYYGIEEVEQPSTVIVEKEK